MKRQKKAVVPAIPPYLDQFGKPCWENPFGRYRPNPALTGETPAPVVQPIFINGPSRITEPPVAAPPVVFAAPVAAEPVIATVADEAPVLAAENSAAALASPASERLHLSAHTTAPMEAIAATPLAAFDTTDPVYQGALSRYSEIFGLTTNTEIETTAPALQTRRLPADNTDRRTRIKRRAQRTVAVVTAVGGGLVGISAAQAYFTSTGSGSGSGSTGTLAAMTATATVTGTLIPDGSVHNVTVNVTNPNSYDVTLKSVTANGAPSGSGGKGTCATTGVTFTDQTGLSDNLPANTATPKTFTGAATMSTAAEDGCQGATISIPVTITVQK